MREFKRIKDPIYGYIQIPVTYMTDIVDTSAFQRLRRILQTSYSPLYSSAVHNRFVHSMGVYYLGELASEQLLREIDNKFSLSNVIEADEDTILVFNCDTMMFKQEDLYRREAILSDKLNHKCILLNGYIKLDKAIALDHAKGKDYTTVTYYNDEGNLVKEETTQYK